MKQSKPQNMQHRNAFFFFIKDEPEKNPRTIRLRSNRPENNCMPFKERSPRALPKAKMMQRQLISSHSLKGWKNMTLSSGVSLTPLVFSQKRVFFTAVNVRYLVIMMASQYLRPTSPIRSSNQASKWKRQIECLTNRWDLFHMSIWERAHKRSLERERLLKNIWNITGQTFCAASSLPTKEISLLPAETNHYSPALPIGAGAYT